MLQFWLISVVHQQLQEYEQEIFGSVENSGLSMPNLSSLSFGFSKPSDTPLVQASAPVFNNNSSASMFARPSLDGPPQEFTFGAAPLPKDTPENIRTSNDISMDGS